LTTNMICYRLITPEYMAMRTDRLVINAQARVAADQACLLVDHARLINEQRKKRLLGLVKLVYLDKDLVVPHDVLLLITR
jgi:hypothetical protein